MQTPGISHSAAHRLTGVCRLLTVCTTCNTEHNASAVRIEESQRVYGIDQRMHGPLSCPGVQLWAMASFVWVLVTGDWLDWNGDKDRQCASPSTGLNGGHGRAWARMGTMGTMGTGSNEHQPWTSTHMVCTGLLAGATTGFDWHLSRLFRVKRPVEAHKDSPLIRTPNRLSHPHQPI
jgi:hypothetical protein